VENVYGTIVSAFGLKQYDDLEASQIDQAVDFIVQYNIPQLQGMAIQEFMKECTKLKLLGNLQSEVKKGMN
jgi:hypothetical protein